MAKTNLQYLQDLLAENDEAIEWLDGLTAEYQDKIDDLKKQVKELEIDLDITQDERDNLQSELDEKDKTDGVIDFGLAKIEYRPSGNLKVDSYMEDLAEKVKLSF